MEIVTAVTVILGGVSTVGIIIIKLIIKAKDAIEEINDAVNHKHQKTGDPNAMKLYDRVHQLAVQMEMSLELLKAHGDKMDSHSKKLDANSKCIAQVKAALDDYAKWQASYNDSPWKDGPGVQKWLQENERRFEELLKKVENCPNCSKQ